MQLIHDVDVLLLLALALSSKRRPAQLVEIVAATDLLTQGGVPSETRLVEAFARLGSNGLACEQDGGFLLTPEAQKIITGTSRKADTEQRMQSIRDKLSVYEPTGDLTPIRLTAKTVCAAILAHRDSAKITGKNLLVPKPKPADTTGPRPGQRQRRPLPARRRKD
ncbi:MAG: hypothetical protein WCK63_15710 [Betaproteobacteria bacterium]